MKSSSSSSSSRSSETSKWLATVGSIWIQCTCGASYAFGIYSPVLKSTQGYTQSTLDTVSVFKDIGANAGILSGILYAAVTAGGGDTHRRYRGPWMVHAAGVVQCFIGYFFMWLAVTGAIPRPPVGVMCLFMFLGAHAQTFFNTANVVTAVHNFPQYNGTVVGIMKGFLGLSGAVLVQVYYTFFRGKQTTFLLMLAILPSILTVLLMFLVKINDTPTRDVKKHLNSFSWVSIIIASYLTFLIIMEDVITLPRVVQMCLLAVLFVLLSSPLGIAIRAQKQDSQRLLASSSTTPLLNDYEASADTDKLSATDGGVNKSTIRDGVSSEDLLALEKDMSVLQAIGSMNFWLLFVAMMCGMGSGLATINNISQIGESLGYTMAETSALVSLWSIWNFLGRFMAGFMSDVLLHKKGWPRPIFICGTLVTMSIGHIVIASGFPGNLYVGSVLVGISYGAQWSLMPTITSDIFGVKNMGTIFNTIAVASPVGSYMFSVQAIGGIYDRETSGEDNACYGTHCFMLSFFILASVSLCGSLVALVLFFKTKSYYTRVVIRRLRRAAKQ